jgi:hypothetical protein
MIDENWTPSDEYPAPLFFHCPNTNCDGHVKLPDRSRYYAIRCDKCGLEFAIGADTQMRNAEIERLNGKIQTLSETIHQLTAKIQQQTRLLGRTDDGINIQLSTLPERSVPAWLLVLCGAIVGSLVGILIGKYWIT